MAIGNGACTFAATSLAALAQSSQVALGPGIATFGLLEQGLVHEGPGHGELGHVARDRARVARQPHPLEEGPEIRLEIGRVLQMGAQVEHVARDAAEIDDARDVRPLAGGELNRQVLVDGLERNLIENDLDVLVLLLEAAQQVGHDLAFVAVRVPGHPQGRLRLRVTNCQACREYGTAQEHFCALHCFLHFVVSPNERRDLLGSVAPQRRQISLKPGLGASWILRNGGIRSNRGRPVFGQAGIPKCTGWRPVLGDAMALPQTCARRLKSSKRRC